jgi:hypothetical protein
MTNGKNLDPTAQLCVTGGDMVEHSTSRLEPG